MSQVTRQPPRAVSAHSKGLHLHAGVRVGEQTGSQLN